MEASRKITTIVSDDTIIQLYWNRDEDAIEKSDEKYGAYCYQVAHGILREHEDAKECVNDTWFHSWKSIPPTRPLILKAFFAKLTRNLSLDCYKAKHTLKRGGGVVPLAFDELSECVSGTECISGLSDHAQKGAVEEQILKKELITAINNFLATVSPQERKVFVRRYFFFEENVLIAKRYGISEANVRKILSRTRKKLKEYLMIEGLY